VCEIITRTFERIVGSKYAFAGRDGVNVKQLLAFDKPAEIADRWERALRQKYPPLRTTSELVAKWNHLAPKQAGIALEAPATDDSRKQVLDDFIDSLTPDERLIFDTYEREIGIDLGPDERLKSLVRDRVSSHAPETLCAAIRGYMLDDWNRAKGPKTLEAILKTADTIATNAKRAGYGTPIAQELS